jgi:hypothetical protein
VGGATHNLVLIRSNPSNTLAAAEAAAAEAKAQAAKAAANKKAGALPKGFEPATAPEPAKSSRGTLPKGF